jgi:DNA-binding LacI/PurR family transcriptional regulator
MAKADRIARAGATSYDVARHAGVSQSAVSRCFRPGASIAPETRAKIVAVAEQLGYRPNAIARGLITRRSNMVAVIIKSLTNLYYPEVLAELSERFSARDIRVLLFALKPETDVDTVLEQIWRHRPDGAIVAAPLSPEQLSMFGKRHIPLVLYNCIGEEQAVASVCFDSADGARRLVSALIDAGHRRFGIIAGPEGSYVGEERVRASTDELRRQGLEPILVRGEFDYTSGDRGLRQLMLKSDSRLDAVICANDTMAIGAIDCARYAFGFLVPEQLSVVGFDGVEPATWAAYQVTTVRQPVRRMTEAAVEMLMERFERPGLPPERRFFGGQLLVGKSARLVAADCLAD